jgi:nucleoside-diphosphate-sugar epimerase
MVNIIVLGGTGPTGLALINEALSRRYTVIIYARSPQKLPPEITSNPFVIIVKGTLEEEDAIAHCFTIRRKDEGLPYNPESQTQSHPEPQSQPPAQPQDSNHIAADTDNDTIRIDAIVSALGPPVTGVHPRGHPLAQAYQRFIRIANLYGVNRFVVLGTASINDEFDKFDIRFKTLVFG